ncbi:MAG: hypothetical protein WCG52_11430 [bacterium]
MLLHCGAQTVSRKDLLVVPTPCPAMKTQKPSKSSAPAPKAAPATTLRACPYPRQHGSALCAAQGGEKTISKNLENADWLTKEGLRVRLNLPSTRMVDELARRRQIPVVKFGHRTVRFFWPAVEAALKHLEIREIGR